MMISFDTNILFPAIDHHTEYHLKARRFLAGYAENETVCICEQVLMELYCLIRNPKVCKTPLTPMQAFTVIRGFRSNPHWRVVDVHSDPHFMESIWELSGKKNFAYRKIFDLRLAKTLQQHQVTDFATRNLKDFQNLGFNRVWDPFL
ncbi:MAG: TA system VapC family ribonuclease toxin [Kiritimatiellia bacterium]